MRILLYTARNAEMKKKSLIARSMKMYSHHGYFFFKSKNTEQIITDGK